MQFRHERLDNGLEVIAEISPSALSTSVGFFVNTGSRDETDAEWGLSHFLEHMVFKGTEDLSADEINRRFDAMGAAANAFTSEEDTVYFATVLPASQREAVELFASILRPSLREDDFETEKKVILEEIQMYDDQPPFGADDRCRAAFLRGHPLARSVLGTLESIRGMQVGTMHDYHRRRYAPNNIVLAASGAVDFEQLLETARRCSDAWEPCELPARRAKLPPLASGGGAADFTDHIVRPAASLEYAIRLSAAPDACDPARYAAKWLSMILGDDSGSRFYWAFIDSGEADYASCHHHDFLDAGMFVIQLSADADITPTLLERVDEIIADVSGHGFTPEELARARSKLASRIVLSGERPRRRLFGVGLEWAHNRSYRSVADDLGIVERLTADDLAAVCDRWPLGGSRVSVLAGPLDPAAAEASAGESQA